MLGHGMSYFLKERLMDTSDIYSTYVCEQCGLFAQRMIDKDLWYCPGCENTTKVANVIIPYAFKLLVQELMAMSIAPRLRV
jgi:DNA-directed RNA polymerase II subunit RPB2